MPARGAVPWLAALGILAFAALGFLPAVAVQAAAQPIAARVRLWLVGGAYVLSGAAARTACVPPLLVQPLVENAVRPGADPATLAQRRAVGLGLRSVDRLYGTAALPVTSPADS